MVCSGVTSEGDGVAMRSACGEVMGVGGDYGSIVGGATFEGDFSIVWLELGGESELYFITATWAGFSCGLESSSKVAYPSKFIHSSTGSLNSNVELSTSHMDRQGSCLEKTTNVTIWKRVLMDGQCW